MTSIRGEQCDQAEAECEGSVTSIRGEQCDQAEAESEGSVTSIRGEQCDEGQSSVRVVSNLTATAASNW